ncbi:MAG: hypothetical protein HC933_00805 [Pleurocapsa sp. SU_196_0]|nr:hypothetical protein [Pleurocapsa sp. SU_196_0]
MDKNAAHADLQKGFDEARESLIAARLERIMQDIPSSPMPPESVDIVVYEALMRAYHAGLEDANLTYAQLMLAGS